MRHIKKIICLSLLAIFLMIPMSAFASISPTTYESHYKYTKAFADGSKVDYIYDSAERLTEVHDTVSGFIYFEYDILGNVTKETTPNGSVSYTYDVLGRRTSMTASGQEPVYYAYNEDGRMVSLSSNGMSFGFEYDALGRRTSLSYPNGQMTNYSYDAGSNLLSIEHIDSSNSTIEKIAYGYDPNGNRTKADRQNVSPKSSSNMSATYDSANRMTTFNTENLLYDDNGNLVQKGDTFYQWDARGRLVGLTNSTMNASFKYDALGRRIEKTINGKTTQYLYDGLDIVQEIEDGMVSVNYIRTLNIDEPLARIKTDGSVRYYQQDGLGSVIALTDETGVIKTQYVYDTFGNTSFVGERSDNTFQYTGRENDETGLYYYRARYYSPELHRFISEDPIGSGVNHYSYVNNNPLNYMDPLGLEKCKDGLAYDDNGKLIGEKGLEAPLLDPIDLIPAGAIASEAPKALKAVTFVLNHNKFFRIGWGRRGGDRVFRASGDWVRRLNKRFRGIDNSHIDFWKGGPL